ncbi:trehalose-phosphatase [Elongatibacter sediminis]|uniref:Trehalose 6-phosphate phosphatase n=1 Tax=Elongatibacter sediminis TaxID=3119006 RepID=A0AAW9R6M8_9GAMM
MNQPPQTFDPTRTALFLDVDGTLLEIEQHPDAVAADPDLIQALGAASHAVDHALALISGRSLEDLDRIFSPERFAAGAAHGTELRGADGATKKRPAPSLPAGMLARLDRFVARADGLLCERKAAGFSLHYRKAPDYEPQARSLVKEILAELGEDFRLIDGKMVLEIAPRAHTKGEAIRWFLSSPPFTDRRPVFVGDDVTDEDGFRYVNTLGGYSIRVGGNAGSLARYTLDNVAAVRRWMSGAFAAGICADTDR